MFKRIFLKVTLRSLVKSKVFVFINIVGLGLALACCIVAYLNYNFAQTFDVQHEIMMNFIRFPFIEIRMEPMCLLVSHQWF